jgi:hypothetical protein
MRPKTVKTGQFVEIGKVGRKIPVYDLRDVNHHKAISNAIANKDRIALFGGVWGVFKGVGSNTQKETYFHTVKKGRPKESKIAMLVSPGVSSALIDWDKVHPQFRHLRDLSRFQDLWTPHGAFLHVIGPVNPKVTSLPDVFLTTPEDFKFRYPNLEPIQSPTACFVWRDDPYIEHVTDLAQHSPQTNINYVGVSTLNPHGIEPPYTYEELISYLNNGQIDPNEIDIIVRDSIYELNAKALGSHTQIRLPLDTETPVLKVMRIGSLSPDGFTATTGYRTESGLGIKDVRRIPGQNCDDSLFFMGQQIRQKWKKASLTTSNLK